MGARNGTLPVRTFSAGKEFGMVGDESVLVPTMQVRRETSRIIAYEQLPSRERETRDFSKCFRLWPHRAKRNVGTTRTLV